VSRSIQPDQPQQDLV